MTARIPAETRIQQINALPNVEFLRWLDGYKNNTSKAVVRCKVDGYEWVASVSGLVSGKGCHQCGGVRAVTPAERIDQINKTKKIMFVRWHGSWRGARSKAVLRCLIDGFEWEAQVQNVVNQGTGCPQCSGVRRWTRKDREEQISALESIQFVGWVGGYNGNRSKVLVKCRIDGFEWEASVNSLLHNKTGCPQCAGNRRYSADERISQINNLESIEFIKFVDKYIGATSKVLVRCKKDLYEWASTIDGLVNAKNTCHMCNKKVPWTEDERVDQINRLTNIKFIRFVNGYSNSHSKALVRCEIDGFEWEATANNLVNQGKGCPKCAPYGFQLGKIGVLYALRSECGRYMKVGISNKPKQRHRQLEKATPFPFYAIEQISGDGAKIAELEKYFHNKYERAGLSGFDGATEWLVCTDELLKEIIEMGR